MVARTLQRQFGSFALDTTNGVTLTEWPSRLQIDSTMRPRVAGRGAVRTRLLESSLQFQLAGVVAGSDTGTVRDRSDALAQALRSGENWLQLYADRRIRCHLSDLQVRERSGAPQVRDFTATLVARWPYFESPTLVQSSHSLSGAGPHVVALAGNTGSAETWPTVRLTNLGAAVGPIVLSVATVTSTQVIQLGGLSLASGGQILIDMREGRLGDAVGTPTRPAFVDGSFWALPAGIASTIEVAHNIGASASLSLVVSWYPAHHTV